MVKSSFLNLQPSKGWVHHAWSSLMLKNMMKVETWRTIWCIQANESKSNHQPQDLAPLLINDQSLLPKLCSPHFRLLCLATSSFCPGKSNVIKMSKHVHASISGCIFWQWLSMFFSYLWWKHLGFLNPMI
jgi:hypothetical protein